MKKLQIMLVLLNVFMAVPAQKVFSVEYANQADVKVFVVKYENQADLKIFFVEYENQAGWREKKKMHLMY